MNLITLLRNRARANSDPLVMVTSTIMLLVALCTQGFAEEPTGPFQPNWESIEKNYQVPDWFRDGKFGIFLHWGLYSVPARQSEWYVKHMYGNRGVADWHVEHFGPQDKFGYKDFIPLFTCEKFDATEWAELFAESGATYVVPTAEHHDGFALWDSQLTKWDAKEMGPKRDLIGELAVAVRKQGLRFGVSNHRMEHFDFINPLPGLKHDLLDPASADFYSFADRSPEAHKKFLDDWVARNFELIDKYQPDMLWFDNGVNSRELDPLKLRVAAYYYNRALQWNKQVTLSTKSDAYLAGSVKDYERQGRGPKELTDYVWQVDDTVHQRWGYLSDAQYTSVGSIISRLVDNVSRNGNLMMNFSPKPDGTIPDEQKLLLKGVGKWLSLNGEAIYRTRPWIKSGEGSREQTYRFTTHGQTLYAIAKQWPGSDAIIESLGTDALPAAKISKVELLGHKQALAFERTNKSLKIKLPGDKPCEHAFVLKISGDALLANNAAETRRFDFGSGAVEKGFVAVSPELKYDEKVGYGFEPGSEVQSFTSTATSPLANDGVTSTKPFYFSVKIPEGNYEVAVTLGGDRTASTTTVKAELRRLMLENIVTQPGETSQQKFVVNVRRPELSDGSQVQLKDREKQSEWWAWDDKLTLEFNGNQPAVCAVEIKPVDNVPTLYLLGDSTVCDQPREPFASWGQMLPRFFGPGIIVANHAQSGESLRSSRGARRLAKVLDKMRAGDWVLIQYGHNDMKAVDEAAYKAELKRYVAEVKAKNGRPIIITPMHRRTFEGDKIKNSHRGFPDAVRELAREEMVPMVDLHAMSQSLYEAWGPQESIQAFSTARDGTHHNNYGAYQLAKCVVESIRSQHLELAGFLAADVKPFDASYPDSMQSFAVPASAVLSTQKPDGD